MLFIFFSYTVPGPVDQPPEVNESDITATTAVVRWSPPADPNGEVVGYRVNYTVISSDPGRGQGGRRKRQTVIMRECIIGGDIDRNIAVGNNTMATLTGLSK